MNRATGGVDIGSADFTFAGEPRSSMPTTP